jgi:hypothetical protein
MDYFFVSTYILDSMHFVSKAQKGVCSVTMTWSHHYSSVLPLRRVDPFPTLSLISTFSPPPRHSSTFLQPMSSIILYHMIVRTSISSKYLPLVYFEPPESTCLTLSFWMSPSAEKTPRVPTHYLLLCFCHSKLSQSCAGQTVLLTRLSPGVSTLDFLSFNGILIESIICILTC